MFPASRFMAVALVAVACAPFAPAQERTPAQSREELATRLKRTVDRRLAEAVRRVREEIHRDIDAALRQDKTDPAEIERLLGAMDDPAAGSALPPAPPKDEPADTVAPARPIRRRPGALPEVARADSDQMIADLDRQLTELAHRGATGPELDGLRQRVVELREGIARRRDGADQPPGNLGGRLSPPPPADAPVPHAGAVGAHPRDYTEYDLPAPTPATPQARAWLGATFGPVAAEFRASHDIPTDTGLRVIQTAGDLSPAVVAGLKANDVVLALGGTPVTTVAALAAAIGARRAGETVELSVLRDGVTSALTLRLGAAPATAPPPVTSAQDVMKAAEAAALKEVLAGDTAVPPPAPEGTGRPAEAPAQRPTSRRARRAASRPAAGGD